MADHCFGGTYILSPTPGSGMSQCIIVWLLVFCLVRIQCISVPESYLCWRSSWRSKLKIADGSSSQEQPEVWLRHPV